jgi:glycosyltransferase involved in cell wall biosynthesis
MKDLVSVIVPIYNTEKYLKKCLDSIIHQTHKNLEIMLFVDGSPDGSAAICRQYERAETRIKVIESTNLGLSEARNKCLDFAKGDFFFFVDSDDWLSIDAIETLLKLAQSNDADVVVGDFLRTNSEEIAPVDDKKLPEIRTLNNLQALKEMNGILGTRLVIACGKLYRRSTFKDVRYPRGRYHEDEATTYRVLFNADKISLTDQVVYFYRVTPGSIATTPNLKKSRDSLLSAVEKMEFMERIGRRDLIALAARSLFHKYIRYDMAWNAQQPPSGADFADLISADQIRKILNRAGQPVLLKYFATMYFQFPWLGRLLMKRVITPFLLSPKYRSGGMRRSG